MKLGCVEEGLRYQPSRDQLEVASSIAESLESLLPLSRVHVGLNETSEVWSALSELGLFSIVLDETQGGCGLSAAEETLIVVELGRRLAAPSVLATIGASHALWPADGLGFIGRRTAAAYLEAGRGVVIDDPAADCVLVRSAKPAVRVACRTRTIDERMWSVALAEAEDFGDVLAVFEPREALRLKLLDAAALAGLSIAALEMSVAYAGLREQFGRPIGSFQAIKHRCARMALASRSARDLATFAAVAFDDGRTDAGLLVDEALFIAGTAALDNASSNIQIHGGIGFSDEADPHLLLKRAQVLLALAGGLEKTAERVADALGQDDPS